MNAGIDFEKFYERINHYILLSRIARKIEVCETKSAVDHQWKIKFSGFNLYKIKGDIGV